MSTLIGYVRGAPVYQICGSDSGYSTAGDLVTATIDGADLNEMWAEFAATLDIINTARSATTELLAFRTTRSADAVAQTLSEEEFDLASEFGEPTGIRTPKSYLTVGYPFLDYDKATRFTWRFLRDATQEQVEAVHNLVLNADNKLTTTAILRRLFTPTAGVNSDGRTVYGLYSGDGTVPPPYSFTSFGGTHSHYLVSGAAAIDSGDLEDLYNTVREHGYLDTPGTQALLFAPPGLVKQIARFRAGVISANAVVANHDFIPSTAAPPYLTDKVTVGPVAPGNFQGLKIEGSYGPTWITESSWIPPNYLLIVATGGPNSSSNPVGFREHANPTYQGLRILPGNQQRYPLVDSFYSRGFGVGVRHRGAAAVMQVTTNATYTTPTFA